MKGEKTKLILVYILMLVVIGLIVALTFTILNNKKEKPKDKTAEVAPTVNVNPYPEISNECTFNLTIDEYNGLTGPKCKNGYSRYNVNNLEIDGKKINVVVIYSDQNGNKAGLYLNDKRFISEIDNVSNIKLSIYGDKLFTLNNSNGESNVLVFKNNATKLYDLKETLDNSKIADPAIQNIDNIVTSKTIDPNSFIFTETNITFKTRFIDTSNQVINGSTYQVTINKDKFSKPEFVQTN